MKTENTQLIELTAQEVTKFEGGTARPVDPNSTAGILSRKWWL
jgi:hypothetical protein